MSTTITQKLTVAGAVLAGALLLSAPGLATPMPLPAPTIPGVAPLPGPIAAASTPAANMGILKTKPDIGAAGTSFSLAGSGLGANKDVSIVWNTANVTWMVDARPDSVDYLGRKVDKVSVVLAQTKTDAQGAFSLNLKAPKDFGGIHDMYAVVDGVQLAKGGFLIARTATMTPKKGPIGTMITLRYSGLGSSLYEGGASMQYDNHYVGAVMANWTRGVATVKFRASGPVGRHIVEIADAISFDYLNIPQSPIPWAVGHRFAFKVTKDAGLTEATPRLARRGRADHRRKDDAVRRRARGRQGLGDAQLDVRTDPLEGGRLRERPHAERSRQHRVVDRRRQPRQLQRHVLELRLGAARQRDGDRRRLVEEHGRDSGRARRLARDPAPPGRERQGAGAVLREAERRRDLGAQAQGRPGVHRPPEGRRLDAARQHDRRRLRQQLHRLRLRLQLQRRRRSQPRRDAARRGRT